MDLLSLAALCGPWVAPSTTVSIIGIESGGHPFAIHDNTSGRSYWPGTLEQAARLAKSLLMSGHRLDLGLMQINANAWFAPARVTLGEAFNPCLNIAFGTTILSAAYARQSGLNLSPAEALKRALSVYNSGSATRGAAYADQSCNGRPEMAPRRASTWARWRPGDEPAQDSGWRTTTDGFCSPDANRRRFSDHAVPKRGR